MGDSQCDHLSAFEIQHPQSIRVSNGRRKSTLVTDKHVQDRQIGQDHKEYEHGTHQRVGIIDRKCVLFNLVQQGR